MHRWILVSFVCAQCICLPVLLAIGELPDTKSMGNPQKPPSEESRKGRKKERPPSFGFEIKKFGEVVAERVDRLVKKNTFEMWGDPWTIQGLPLIFPSASTGFNLGLRILLNNMKREDPHEMEIEGQALASDRGRYKHFLKLDLPHAFGGDYRFTGRISYNRDINFRYFGIGNETVIDRGLMEADSPLYQNIRSGPSASLQFLRYLGKQVRVGPVLGFTWTDVSYPATSLLASELPIGISGGRTHFLGLAAIYDTLDFESYPTRGVYHELYFQMYNALTGSNYDFLRSTYTYRRYVPLHPELVFAQRLLLEAFWGNVPFYELGATGGSNSTIGFGGDRYYRGYPSNQYIDQIKFALGFELRWDPIAFEFANQDITLGIVPFVDFGRVWNKAKLELNPIHVSAGWGGRLAWNKRLVIRTDFAVTPDATSAYLELGHSF